MCLYIIRIYILFKARYNDYCHLLSESQNRELRDSVVQVLNQYVMNHFTDIIGNVLNMELQRQLLPRVNAKMDQLQNQMQLEIVQKLNVFDKTVKENIAQVCKSKVMRQGNTIQNFFIVTNYPYFVAIP